jgi:hypothetical protein
LISIFVKPIYIGSPEDVLNVNPMP